MAQKKSSTLSRGRVYPVVPPLFAAKPRPYPIPTDRKRNIGRTRLYLLQVSAEPLRKEFGAVLLLPCTLWQLSGRRMGRVLVFVIALIWLVLFSISLPLFCSKVNDKIVHSIEKTRGSFVQYVARGRMNFHRRKTNGLNRLVQTVFRRRQD